MRRAYAHITTSVNLKEFCRRKLISDLRCMKMKLLDSAKKSASPESLLQSV